METKFNFNSQICTSKVQSERLLALGLKKETADMGWQIISINGESVEMKTEDNWERQEVMKNHFPAWSLHRLIEMMPNCINEQGWLSVGHCGLHYSRGYGVADNSLYNSVVRMYEWLIKEGYFNKEYLV